MDNLIKDTATLELFSWEAPKEDRVGLSIWQASSAHASSKQQILSSQVAAKVQDYLIEYHLEFFRQQRFSLFPSRLHASILFATRIDAHVFCDKNPPFTLGKDLIRFHTEGSYTASFHDASWVNYMRLPQQLSLSDFGEIAGHYWSGRTVEESAPSFLGAPWQEEAVIETLFCGELQTQSVEQNHRLLPRFY